jgi:hypothetical protein
MHPQTYRGLREARDFSKEGVEFVSPPKEQFYGTEAIVRDNSGNWFSLT